MTSQPPGLQRESPQDEGERRAMNDARLQAHWALQVAAAAASLLVPEDDFSHTTLTWDASLQALCGRNLHAAGDAQVALRLADLTLLVCEEGTVAAEHNLNGRSLREAFGWVSQALKRRGATFDVEPLPHALPFHAVSQGLLFDGDRQDLKALSDWFDFSWPLLKRCAQSQDRASPVRCWPHHFDCASLMMIDEGDGTPESMRSIGIGMSPGDHAYDQPYWYVSPWPYPSTHTPLGDLPAGAHWHREGFTAAILSRAAMGPDPKGQSSAFLDAAIAVCRALL